MRKERPVRAVLLLAVAACAIAGLPAASAKDDDPNASVHSVEYFPSVDGVLLHADVWRPKNAVESGTRTPVILTVSPYAGSGGHALGPNPLGEGPGTPGGGMFARGYSRATVSLRGTGASGGCMDFMGPGEIADVKAAVEHFADTTDGRWSGKVGMTGSSYDGFTQIAALAAKPNGLALIIAGAPPTGYHNNFHNGVRNTGGGHGLAALYAASDKVPPSVNAPAEEHTTSLSSPTADGCLYAPTVLGSYDNDPQAPFWQARDLATLGARGSSVPTVWRQGFNDWQVRPTGFLDIFNSLTGPRLGLFGPWDHGAPNNGDEFARLTARWMDHYLLNGPPPGHPDVMVQDFDGSWRAENAWPPADSAPFTLPLNGGTYQDRAGNNGETGLPAAFGMFPVSPPTPLRTGEGIWSITAPLSSEVHLAGVAEVTASIGSLVPGVHAAAIVYDIDADGMARMVTRGVTVVRPDALGPSSGEIRFDLYPQDWRFPAGHRIGVLLTGSDDIWFEPGTSGTPVDVLSASIDLPVLGCLRVKDLKTGPFRPRTPHAPFQVDAATIDNAGIDSALPVADDPLAGRTGRCVE